ncbi:MAG: GAF domain-containing protein, partial [Chloroflexi bacterium]|nr:GAF domain-containing protein [Chloroflexota bacterium]
MSVDDQLAILNTRISELEELCREQTALTETLETSEQRYRKIFDHSNDAILIINPGNDEIIDFNAQACTLLGYSKEELESIRVSDIHPYDMDKLIKFGEAVVEIGHGWTDQLTCCTKSGTPVASEISASAIDIGGSASLIVMIRDVTQRKEIEQALSASEAHHKTLAKENASLVEIGKIISASLDIGEVFHRFSGEVGNLIQFDRLVISTVDLERWTTTIEHISGIDISSLDQGDQISLSSTHVREIVSGRTGLIYQVDDSSELASQYPAIVNLTDAGLRSFMSLPLISSDEVIGLLLIRSRTPDAYTDRDLQLAQRVADQIAGAVANSYLHAALERESSERETLAEIGRIINSSLDMDQVYERVTNLIHDLVSFDRLSIVTTNFDVGTITIAHSTGVEMPGWDTGAARQLDGTNSEAIIRAKEGIVWGTADLEVVANQNRSATDSLHSTGLQSALSVPLISNDDPIGILNLGSKTPDFYTDKHLELAQRVGSQIAGAIANAQLYGDMQRAEKARAELEQQLLQSQKMEALGTLAGGIAHDFNNMLTAIVGYAQLGSGIVSDGDPVHRFLSEIQNAAQRAASLTRQLLAFSRKQIIQPKVLNLNDLVLDMGTMIRRLINEDIELITLPAKDLGLVNVDPTQMEQVLVNLAVNARDAMLDGGKLVIKTANVVLDEEYAKQHPDAHCGRYVSLTVEDDGAGMTEETRAHIFDPFFTTKETGKGTGLGLSTCYGIVSQNGGHISVESELGHGTTIQVFLPVVEGEVERS